MLSRLSRSSLNHTVRNKTSMKAPLKSISQSFSSVNEDYGVWPVESEGNDFKVNWSLTVDGVVPVGEAFRNARTSLLATRLPSKVTSGVVDLKTPPMIGKLIFHIYYIIIDLLYTVDI